jgi:hypothetical protein
MLGAEIQARLWLCLDGGLAQIAQMHLKTPSAIEIAMLSACAETTSSHAVSHFDAVPNLWSEIH